MARWSPEEIARRNKLAAENAATFKEPVTDYINEAVEIFQCADKWLPETKLPEVEIYQLPADDKRTFRYPRGAGGGFTHKMMKRVRRERYPDRPEITDFKFSKSYEELSDPVMLRYAHARAKLASSFMWAVRHWEELNPEDTDNLEWLEAELREGDIDSRKEIKHAQQAYRDRTYLHDVLFADILPYVADPELTEPGGTLELPVFKNRAAGEALMTATIAAQLRIADIAVNPEVTLALAKLTIDDIEVARKRPNTRKPSMPKDQRKQHSATRMLSEAVDTVAQATSLLLADVDQDFDIAHAISSLERNGAYKLLGIITMGIIGPLAINGTKWDPAYVLDADMLQRGEFAISDKLRQNIIDMHVRRRTLHLGRATRKISPVPGKGEILKFAGCPAKSEHMKFAVDLIIKELSTKSS